MAGSKVSSRQEMGLHDDIFYTSFEVPVDSYPRIKYFQSRLKDIFSRLQRLYDPIPESLKRPNIESRYLIDAVDQLTVSNPVLFLFGSKIPKEDLVQESGPTKVETHLPDEIPHFSAKEKEHKLFRAICTLRLIETRKGKDTLLKLKDRVGVENMLLYVDAQYEKDKDSVVNSLERSEEFLRQKIVVVYQSKNELSAAISNHMERKFIKVFIFLNQYLKEATWKTRLSCGSIFGQGDVKEQLVAAIMAFFKTPLTLIDFFLTIKPKSSEKVIHIEKATQLAIVHCTKIVLIREFVSKYEVKGIGVTEYLEELKYDEKCLKLLEKSKAVENTLSKAQLIKPHLITQLQNIPKHHKTSNFVMELLSKSGLVEYGYISGKQKEKKNSLQTQFEAFSKTISEDVSNVLLSYFLEIGSKFKGIRIKLNTLSYLREELQRIMEQTIDETISVEVIPDLQNWTDLLRRIKEVQAVGHIFRNLCVFVKEPEAGERANEVLTNIRKCLVDYPGEIRIEVSSGSFYAGGDGIEGSKQIAMGDGFLNGNCCGTIGLFMNKNGNEDKDLHFVTCNHVVLKSEEVTTIDPTPIPLGRRVHNVSSEDKLLDISVIQVYPQMRDRCNPYFQDNNNTRKCHILDMENIKKQTAPGVLVCKKGLTTKLTTGCIISKDFTNLGVQKHNIIIGVPAGSDEETLTKGFAQEGDSGSVVYTETPNGEILYISILMGELKSQNVGDKSIEELKETFGPLILTSSLYKGLDHIQKMSNCKFALPKSREP